MKPHLNNNQYEIRLRKSGKRQVLRVHKLMQATYFRPSKPGEAFYHVNGDRLDNSINNFGFLPKQELGRLTGSSSKRIPVAKIDDATGEIVHIYPSARAAARDNFMCYQTVMDRCNGKVKKRAIGGYRYEWDS
jgi:hypothetical protein